MNITNSGSTPQMVGTGYDGKQEPHPSGDLSCPHLDGVFEVTVFKIPEEDPFVYRPMSWVSLVVGQKVMVRSMDGTGLWGFAWVLEKYPNKDGYDHPWYLLGSRHQLPLLPDVY